MFTRQHYLRFESAIARKGAEDEQSPLYQAKEDIAFIFADDNARFDKKLFLANVEARKSTYKAEERQWEHQRHM